MNDRRGRRRGVGVAVAAALLATLVVVPLASEAGLAEPASSRWWATDSGQLVFTASGDRLDQRSLNGAMVPSGSFIGVALEGAFFVHKVDFSINGQHRQTEYLWPYDLAGTGFLGVPRLFNVNELPVGPNIISARVTNWLGYQYTVQATFERAAPNLTVAPGFDFTAVETELDRLVSDGHPFNGRPLNGSGIVVVHKDLGTVYESYRGEIARDRVSLIMSTSKSLVGGVLLHLSEQYGFGLDQPLGTIPNVKEWAGNLAHVTPAQLLSNTSGLFGLPHGYVVDGCAVLWQGGDINECGRLIANNPLNPALPPNTLFQYGGPQWQVAGAVATSVSGKSWNELINEIYVEPCGLGVLGWHTLQLTDFLANLVPSGGQFSPYPAGFDGNPANATLTNNPIIEGGAFTRPTDYAALLQMQLNDGVCTNHGVQTQVLPADRLHELYDDRIGGVIGLGRGPDGYALGWQVHDGGKVVVDPGAFGASAWIDHGEEETQNASTHDDYAVYYVVESVMGLGGTEGNLETLRKLVDEAMATHQGAGEPPIGHLDGVVSNSAGTVDVWGWAADPSAPTESIDVQVSIGGPAGSAGAELVNIGRAATNRPDVDAVHPGYGNLHGFSTRIATAKTGTQEVCAYGINIGPGSNQLLGCTTVGVMGTATGVSGPPIGSFASLDYCATGQTDRTYDFGDGRWLAEYWNFDGSTNTGNFGADIFTGSPARWEYLDDIHVYWEGGGPAGQGDYFGARYTATIDVPKTCTLELRVRGDDGYALYVDDVRRSEHWGIHPPTSTSTVVTLPPGRHVLRLDFFEWGGGAQIGLRWNLV